MPDETQRPSAGPLVLLRLYLLRRSPAALATDGVLLLMISLLVEHLWRAFYSTLDPAHVNRPFETFFAAATDASALFSLAFEVSRSVAWIALAWAGVRAISDAIRSRPQPPTT